MHFSKIFRVKEGKLDMVRQWFQVLTTDRKEEALATFAHENINREVFVLFKGSDGHDYIIGVNEVIGEHRKGDKEVTINQDHEKIKHECLEPFSGGGEIILDLQV